MQGINNFKKNILNNGLVKIVSKVIYYLMIGYGLHIVGEIIWNEWNIYFTFILFVSILFGLIINILFHELGHLFAGLLGGYSFLLFSIMNIIWIKENRKIEIGKRKSPAPLGQCLMISPTKTNSSKFIFYHLGGIIANFLIFLFALILYFVNTDVYIKISMLVLTLIGILSCISNAIPYGQSDGANILKGLKNIDYRRQIDNILKIHVGIMQGKSYVNLKEYVYLDERQPIFSPTNIIMYSVLVNAYNEEQKYELAFEIIEPLWEVIDKLESSYQLEITKEYFFLLLLISPEREEVKVIKSGEPYCSFNKMERADAKRIQAAYVYIVEKEKDKALLLINQAKKLVNRMPTISDQLNERKMISYIEKMVS
ncbi:hypothetical protein [Marinilactibacillus sp. Marseille-P9653]|uniref:hypothetical protein n=1 Tax=Marinilactibacillus sp. Marseille-P9653 TaxID=2866583 RepID=UPI001CE3C669|nr:hypothetical protein [Marinilactibacillus sp. Marseille-P9653]